MPWLVIVFANWLIIVKYIIWEAWELKLTILLFFCRWLSLHENSTGVSTRKGNSNNQIIYLTSNGNTYFFVYDDSFTKIYECRDHKFATSENHLFV